MHRDRPLMGWRNQRGPGHALLAAESGFDLIRMFGPQGNPQAKNLFSVIGYLQKRAGVRLHVSGRLAG